MRREGQLRSLSDPRSCSSSVQSAEEKLHPCFDNAAFFSCGRIHLPVAPACNIQCVYCLRKFDCMNESRPGVCSKVLRPAEAADRAASYLEEHPETSVVGFAGPGDPLANEETFETILLLAERGVHPLLCLSTNGLYLPENIKRLADLGVQYLTVTVNAASVETAEQIYPWVNYHGNLIHGREAARLLMDGQQEGIRKAAEAGFHIKVNMVLLDGINTDEVLTLAKLLSAWGTERMNINSVINVTGQDFIRPVNPMEVRRLREEASKYIPQMKACAQCRADAAGIPGAEKTAKRQYQEIVSA